MRKSSRAKFVRNNFPADSLWKSIGTRTILIRMGLFSENVSFAQDPLWSSNEFLFSSTTIVLRQIGPFTCDKCGSSLSNRSSFRSHNYLYHNAEKYFKGVCDFCQRSFTDKSYLGKHIKTKHLNHRPFGCKDCGCKSFTRWLLERHMLQHRPKTECNICRKKVAGMKQHLSTHVRMKCPFCSMICSKATVGQHIKKKHKN